MSQLIQFSLRVVQWTQSLRGGKKIYSRQVVVSNGFGAGGGEEAIHLANRVGSGEDWSSEGRRWGRGGIPFISTGRSFPVGGQTNV